MNDSHAFAILVSVVMFAIGGSIGAVSMKWATESDVRTLRAQSLELTKSGKVCCDAAYVAIKYRPDCSAGAAASVKP